MGASAAAVADIRLDALTKRYARFQLGPVTTTLTPGVTALLGANGAGKSTLMRLIVETVRPTAGEVTFARVDDGAPRVGYLPQDFVAPTHATAQDYLSFVAWCRSSRRVRIGSDAVADALASVGLADVADEKVRTLSGGMLRRLGIAQAILGGNRVLVLDEPTVGLDPIQRQDMRDLISALARDSVVLVSTHLAEDVVAVADRVVVLDGGAVAYDGTVAALSGTTPPTATSLEEGFLRLIRGGAPDADA